MVMIRLGDMYQKRGACKKNSARRICALGWLMECHHVSRSVAEDFLLFTNNPRVARWTPPLLT